MILRLKTYLLLKFFNLKEQFFVFKYYKNVKFLLIDLFMFLIYLFINPYKISKKFLIKGNKKDIHLYGETPISIFEKILKEYKIDQNSRFIELGSGRGKLAFWASIFTEYKVIAIEHIAIFNNIARFIKKILKIKNLDFLNMDMLDFDFKKGDIIYFYGTCMEDIKIRKLLEKIKKGSLVISISYPLKDYDIKYDTISFFEASFPWGNTFAYLNIKN